jgi:tyrosine-protein kinase Etk/Wzc
MNTEPISQGPSVAHNAAPYDDDEISLLDLLQTVVENLRLLIIGPLAVGVAALGICFLVTPVYTAKTQFLTPQQQQSSASALIQSLGVGSLAGAAAGLNIRNPADQYIAFMKTDSLQNAMVDRFKLMERYESKFRVDARKTLLERTNFTAGKDGIIKLEFDDKDPEFAAQVANGYLEELKRLMARLAITEAQQRRLFFDRKVEEARKELAEADRVLRSTGISASTLKSSPVAAVEVVARLRGAITAQEIKIGSMRGYLNEAAPEFKQALVELTSLKSQLQKAEKDEPVATGRIEETYIERFRDYKYKETLYELFAKQYELARVDEAREGAVIQVVDPAVTPERKSKPKKALIAVIATLAAGFALLLFVFVRQALRNAAADGESAQKLARLKGAWGRAFGRA